MAAQIDEWGTPLDDPDLQRQSLLKQMPDAPGVTSLAPPGSDVKQSITDPAIRAADPAAGAAPGTMPPPAGPTSGAQPTGAYLKSLMDGGLNPQDAIGRFNKDTGRTTGNEAVYYGPEVHGRPTIGLPGEYLSLENNGWGITPRTPEAPNGNLTGGGGAAAGGVTGPQGPQPFGLQNTGLDMNAIMAELQALIAGQKSPSARTSILSQLKG